MNHRDITIERSRLAKEIADRTSAHTTFVLNAEQRLQDLAEKESMLIGGIDLQRRERGLQVVEVTGDVTKTVHGRNSDQRRTGSRNKVVDDAKQDIATGAQKLRHVYFGIKNYDAFGDQREDHRYGMGPRHGSIVFRVSLSREAVKRLRDGEELTPQEIEDALYVLSTLEVATEARKSA